MKIKYLIILLISTCCILSSFAQDVLYSQYMFNPFVINPAYAGCREAFSAIAINRTQGSVIPGSPNTQTISINTPLSKRIGTGLHISSDQLGPRKTVSYLAAYSYRIPLAVGKLAFGIRAGGNTNTFNWQQINVREKEDDLIQSNRAVITLFNADGGVFYNTRTFYTGLSVNNLGTEPLRSAGMTQYENYSALNFFYSLGNTFEINEQIAIQPSAFVRFTKTNPLNVDLNLNILVEKRLWLGVSYRTSRSLVFLTQFIVSDYFRFGYSFDSGIGNKNRLKRGSHELFLGLDIGKKSNKKLISPRYL
jgi:type IX secretion system PorP/SprF family membrane protein